MAEKFHDAYDRTKIQCLEQIKEIKRLTSMISYLIYLGNYDDFDVRRKGSDSWNDYRYYQVLIPDDFAFQFVYKSYVYFWKLDWKERYEFSGNLTRKPDSVKDTYWFEIRATNTQIVDNLEMLEMLKSYVFESLITDYKIWDFEQIKAYQTDFAKSIENTREYINYRNINARYRPFSQLFQTRRIEFSSLATLDIDNKLFSWDDKHYSLKDVDSSSSNLAKIDFCRHKLAEHHRSLNINP